MRNGGHVIERAAIDAPTRREIIDFVPSFS